MHGGDRARRWKLWRLWPGAIVLQFNQCTPDQQDFLTSVQTASEAFAAGMVTFLFQVVQNRDGDDVIGLDSVTSWVANHLPMVIF